MGQELYGLQVKCFELVGLTRRSLVTRPMRTVTLVLLNFGGLLFCAFTQTPFMIGNLNDVLSATDAACSLFSVINAGVKFVIFFFAQEKIYNLIDEMREMSAEAEQSDPKTIGRMKKVERMIALLFFIATSATGSFYMMLPIFSFFVDVLIRKQEFSFNLPYKASFAYDVTYVPYYMFSYFMDYWGTHATAVFLIGIDSLIFGLCFSLGTHYDILKASYDGDKRKFVQKHQKLIEFSDRLRDIIRPMVFCQFSITATLLCVIGFQVLIDDTVLGRLLAVIYATAALIQLFIYAAGGQVLMDKSSSLSEDFYDLDKDMIIIIARCQKPSEIDAWLYKANFMNFRRVLSSAASFITVLKSFLD